MKQLASLVFFFFLAFQSAAQATQKNIASDWLEISRRVIQNVKELETKGFRFSEPNGSTSAWITSRTLESNFKKIESHFPDSIRVELNPTIRLEMLPINRRVSVVNIPNNLGTSQPTLIINSAVYEIDDLNDIRVRNLAIEALNFHEQVSISYANPQNNPDTFYFLTQQYIEGMLKLGGTSSGGGDYREIEGLVVSLVANKGGSDLAAGSSAGLSSGPGSGVDSGADLNSILDGPYVRSYLKANISTEREAFIRGLNAIKIQSNPHYIAPKKVAYNRNGACEFNGQWDGSGEYRFKQGNMYTNERSIAFVFIFTKFSEESDSPKLIPLVCRTTSSSYDLTLGDFIRTLKQAGLTLNAQNLAKLPQAPISSGPSIEESVRRDADLIKRELSASATEHSHPPYNRNIVVKRGDVGRAMTCSAAMKHPRSKDDLRHLIRSNVQGAINECIGRGFSHHDVIYSGPIDDVISVNGQMTFACLPLARVNCY